MCNTLASMRTLLLVITFLAATPAKHKATPTPVATPMGDAAEYAKQMAIGEAMEKQMGIAWVSARTAYRAAVAAAPSVNDQKKAQAGLDRAVDQCSKSVRHDISETKAFLAADNCDEATKAIAHAEKYLDGDSDPLYAQVQSMKSDMSRSCSGN